jgi:hypothetical protein
MKIIVAGVLLFLSFNAYSQEQEKEKTNDYRRSPIQITFVYPLGTNGVNAANTVNEFSLNVFAGYAAGLDGFEVGGFANIERDFMDGFQVAGFANLVGRGDGVQLAGFLNGVAHDFDGFQGAGYVNFIGGNHEGLILSGFGNLCIGDGDAVQMTGFGNINVGHFTGLQLSGFGNITGGTMDGAQISGFGNIANKVDGMQLSGFLNIANKVDGLQLGLFNVCDSIDGIPIGLASFVRKGYRRMEFAANTALHTNLSFKMGVKHFYNMVSVGANYSGAFKWALGYGIGSEFDLGKKGKNTLNIDLISYNIMENGKYFSWDSYANLEQLRVNFGMKMSERAQVFFGPTVNFLTTRNSAQGQQMAREIAPYSTWNTTLFNSQFDTWVGINGGIRF